MSNLMISTEQHRDEHGMPLWHGACTTGAVSGFGVLATDVRDRQIAVIGGASYAFTTKATPGAPAWRPPTS